VIAFVFSRTDRISLGAASFIRGLDEFKSAKTSRYSVHSGESYSLIELDTKLVEADFLDEVPGVEAFIFVSKHYSSQGVISFTAHSLGNWSSDGTDGGKSHKLGTTSPIRMLAGLVSLSKNAAGSDTPVTYEATHHGPLLSTPSFFMEVGGPTEVADPLIDILAKSAAESVLLEPEFDKIAIGIGAGHYPSKFTKLALDGKYAFSHIMPKHYAAELEMLGQAIEKSVPETEVAVVEWKGLASEPRKKVLDKLNELGIDYVRI
jgi:D-aminoacyl-tRNA deacylase